METKELPCIVCGKIVTVTKFASAAKVKCDECKKSNAQPNPELLSKAIQSKPVTNNSKYDGNTKELPCTVCGKMVTVTKFASAAKVVCDECRGSNAPTHTTKVDTSVKIDVDKLDRNIVPTIEDFIMTPTLINNPKLRDVTCPACRHEFMKILKVVDWSGFGLIIHYQCPHCKLLITLSEQTKELLKPFNDGIMYDYSGNAIESLISPLQGSRMSTTIQKLMKMLKDHNISIEGEKLPPYVWDNDRPVPVGYRIPRDDEAIETIGDAIAEFTRLIEETESQSTPQSIDITFINQLIERLNELLKKGNEDV